METNFTPKNLPVDTYKQTDYSEEVKCVEHGQNEYMGAVLVGHSASADCFGEGGDCGTHR